MDKTNLCITMFGIKSKFKVFNAALLLGFISMQLAQADHHAAAEKSSKVAAPKMPYLISTAMYPEPAQQPNYGPKAGSIRFTDTDPSSAIGGILTMQRAVDDNGQRLDEAAEGITMYMVHWGLEVGEPGIADDEGAGDHGGNCRGFRDTGHVVMMQADELGDADTIEWELPAGTEVPDQAVYFVGHTLYGDVHNLGKCTQTVIDKQTASN